MKQLITIVLLTALAKANAQQSYIDSFAKEGIMYYTKDARNVAVRNFYPKPSIPTKRFIDTTAIFTHVAKATPKHKKEVTVHLNRAAGTLTFIIPKAIVTFEYQGNKAIQPTRSYTIRKRLIVNINDDNFTLGKYHVIVASESPDYKDGYFVFEHSFYYQ